MTQQGKPVPSELQRQQIVRAIRGGCDATTAAARAGVDARTFYDWMALGEREFEGPHRDLFDDVQKAELAVQQMSA
jgi:hypothetical protein